MHKSIKNNLFFRHEKRYFLTDFFKVASFISFSCNFITAFTKMSSFEFNAPQFVNFSDVDDPKADRFFDISEPQEEEAKIQILNSSNIKKVQAHDQSDAENQAPNSTVRCKERSSSKKNFTVRKILQESVNHQIQNETNIPISQVKDNEKDIIQQLEDLQLSGTKQKKSRGPLKATEVFSGVKCQGSEKKSHPMMTRLDAVNRRASKQSLGSVHSEDSSENQVSSTSNHLRTTSLKRNASPLHSVRKFISLAEQVEHFYKDTPERYRSKPSKKITTVRNLSIPKSNCIPKTPKLATKFRQRKVNFPDEKQREEMELEEMKKCQIKAHPLNEKILLGPSLKVPVTKKPVTVPQPFSLTEVKKKEPPPERVFQFKAQPIPTTILNGPVGIPPRRVVSPTIPTTPQIKMPSRLRVEVKSQERNTSLDNIGHPRNTKIEPFSFDARMRDLLQKKEEFVKRVIEEEKKAFNSFKAHPMPDFNSKNENTPKPEKGLHKTTPQPFNLTQPKGNKSFSEDRNVVRVAPFKARPASVIHQKPFMPKLQKHEIQFPLDFHLNTERRAAERLKFDEKIKQKEEELISILKLQKEEEERLEQERKLEERKKTEFKATPMPRYKVFEIHGADPDNLTLPQSPMFSTKTRKTNA